MHKLYEIFFIAEKASIHCFNLAGQTQVQFAANFTWLFLLNLRQVKRMVVPFYMLIRTRIGKASDVVHKTLKIEGVKVSHSVMGAYDVILYAEGKDLDDDVRRIRDTVFQIEGITISETVVHA